MIGLISRIILILGQMEREKSLGYAADYCRICRKVTPHEVADVVKGKRYLFIPLEADRKVGNVQICTGCQTKTMANMGQFIGYEKSADLPIGVLIEATFPTVREVYRDRLEMDEKIAAGGEKVDAETRRRLILEVFGLAEPHFRSGYGHQGRRMLAVAMRPLQPTESEVRECLERFRNSRSAMGRKLSVRDAMVTIYPELEVKKPGEYRY